MTDLGWEDIEGSRCPRCGVPLDAECPDCALCLDCCEEVHW